MSIVERAKQTVQGAAQGLMKKAVELAPDRMIPGGKPDPLISHQYGHVGKPASRVDGPLKVQGKARFAAEFAPDGLCYAALAFSTIAKGRIVSRRHLTGGRRVGKVGCELFPKSFLVGDGGAFHSAGPVSDAPPRPVSSLLHGEGMGRD
jgi:hypothetical protein